MDALSAGYYAVIDSQKSTHFCGRHWAMDVFAVSVFLEFRQANGPDTLGAHRHGRTGLGAML